jgi:hypothetical protein
VLPSHVLEESFYGKDEGTALTGILGISSLGEGLGEVPQHDQCILQLV